jgi:DNA-directed RNA polymerase specialized sigma24 family protein
MNSKDLIKELKKGDERVLAKLYFFYRNPFISYAARKYLIDLELLKEIYHHTILAFYFYITDGKLKKLKCSVKTYLFHLGIVLVVRELKKKGRELVLHNENKKLMDCELPLEYFVENENNLYWLVKQDLNNMDDRDNELLKLYYFENYKIEEITGLMNFKNNESVNSELNTCFEKLKKSITSKYNFNTLFV